MNEMIKCEIEMEDKGLNELLNCLCHCYNNNQFNFAKVCFTIYSIWDYCKNNYWKAKDNEYYNSYKLLEKFGFDKKAVSRYKSSFERFIQGSTIENVFVKPLYFGFSPSKLFEMLTLSYETLEIAIDNQLINPCMTVKQIRELVKTIKNGTDFAEKVLEDNIEEINEEEIPMAYDPSKHYEDKYFMGLAKSQLVNNIITLQEHCEKLQEKIKELKKRTK